LASALVSLPMTAMMTPACDARSSFIARVRSRFADTLITASASSRESSKNGPPFTDSVSVMKRPVSPS
jgi:hypothetical protein